MKIYISNLGIFSTKYEIYKSFCTTLNVNIGETAIKELKEFISAAVGIPKSLLRIFEFR